MSGIHKSKEVYKYTNTAQGKRLVPVRGLYVSGTHLEPWYIDHAVTIDAFTTTEAKCVRYTSRAESLSAEHIVKMLNVDTGTVNIDYYTIGSVTLKTDHMVKMLNVDIGTVNVETYTSVAKTLKADHIVKMLNVDIGTVTYDEFLTREGAVGKQPGIEILEFSTTDPVIS